MPILFKPIRNSAPGEIIGSQFNGDLVPRQYFDEMHPHLTRYVSKNLVAVFDFNTEHGIRECFQNRALYFYRIFFSHNPVYQPTCFPGPYLLLRIQGPSAVTATVCSKCAERLPSSVTAVHPSASTVVALAPRLTIGSIAKTIPGFNLGP
jgi:hypothetical protein